MNTPALTPTPEPTPKSNDDLPALPGIELGLYQHYKGGRYQVLGMVRHSESLEPLVLYRPLDHDVGDWVRPWAMFIETVEVNGQVVPRFKHLG
jgi:hypothetical protein